MLLLIKQKQDNLKNKIKQSNLNLIRKVFLWNLIENSIVIIYKYIRIYLTEICDCLTRIFKSIYFSVFMSH